MSEKKKFIRAIDIAYKDGEISNEDAKILELAVELLEKEETKA